MNQLGGRPGPHAQIAGLAFAMILLDPDFIVAEVNSATEEMLGQSAARLAGRALTEIIELDNPLVIARSFDEDAPVVGRALTLRVAERVLTVDLTLAPLTSHPGWRVMTLSHGGQEDMAGDWAGAETVRTPAVLAHELKNPLAAIRGAGQLLARKLEGRDAALAAIIASEVDRIALLVDRMQSLGSAPAEAVAPFNLHEAVRNALITVRAAGLGETALIEEFDPSLPPVLGCRSALEQVVINLVSNARDASAAGAEPTVTVRTRYSSGPIYNAIRPGHSVRLPIELTVSDNGPGIDPALRKHIFEPFVSSKASGQGLGLALVRKLVRDMDGRITHDRDAQAGLTHFRVQLPSARRGKAA